MLEKLLRYVSSIFLYFLHVLCIWAIQQTLTFFDGIFSAANTNLLRFILQNPKLHYQYFHKLQVSFSTCLFCLYASVILKGGVKLHK